MARSRNAINLNRFDVVSLRLFLTVLERGSLTAGAEHFGISAPATSRRIAELEGHVRTALLDRSARGVVATPAGQVLRQHAIEVVARMEQLAIAMEDVGRGADGHVRVWANSSACTGFLPDVLSEFLQRYPQTKVDLEEAESIDAVKALRSGAADIAVVGENTEREGLESFRCFSDELVLVMPRHHRLADRPSVPFSEALDYDYVGLPRTTSLMRHIGTETGRIGRSFRVRVQVRSFDAMCRMVAAGVGLCILPKASAQAHVRSMHLHAAKLEGVDTTRVLLVVVRSIESLIGQGQTLLELMRKQAS
jgi:DNA-binding transcriptional LysR family regulator